MDGIERCISFVVGKAAQRVNRRARELLAPYGVTPAQYAVLSAIRDRPGLRASDLIERLRIDTATVTGVLDRLELAELITRRDHESDRRVQLISLTAKGRRAMPRMDGAMDVLNEEVRERLGAHAGATWKGLEALGEATERR